MCAVLLPCKIFGDEDDEPMVGLEDPSFGNRYEFLARNQSRFIVTSIDPGFVFVNVVLGRDG